MNDPDLVQMLRGGGMTQSGAFISSEQAAHNRDLELTGRSFDEVRTDAERQWNARLGVITVEGARDDQLATLAAGPRSPDIQSFSSQYLRVCG